MKIEIKIKVMNEIKIKMETKTNINQTISQNKNKNKNRTKNETINHLFAAVDVCLHNAVILSFNSAIKSLILCPRMQPATPQCSTILPILPARCMILNCCFGISDII